MPTLVVTRKVFLPKVLLFANIAFWKLVSFAFSSNICLDLGSTLVGESLQLQLSSSHSCATGVFATLASNVTVKKLCCSKDLSQAMSFDLTLQILQSTMSTRQPHSRTWRWRKVILWEIVFSFLLQTLFVNFQIVCFPASISTFIAIDLSSDHLWLFKSCVALLIFPQSWQFTDHLFINVI